VVGQVRPDLLDAHDLPHLVDGRVVADDVAVRQLELGPEGRDPVGRAPEINVIVAKIFSLKNETWAVLSQNTAFWAALILILLVLDKNHNFAENWRKSPKISILRNRFDLKVTGF
jgi:hypothetical protein